MEAHGCPDPWKHPSPALRCSEAEEQLPAALLLKLHKNRIQSSHGSCTPLTLGGCTDPSHPRVGFSALQQPNQVSPQEPSGKSPAPEGFQGGGVKAEDEGSQRVCSQERDMES